MERMKNRGLQYYFTILVFLGVVALAGCFQPASNNTDDFRNDRRNTTDSEVTRIETKRDPANTSNSAEANNETMTEIKPKPKSKPIGFRDNLSAHIAAHGKAIQDIVDESNPVEKRLLTEYGAVFLTKAVPPSKVMFTSEGEVTGFQQRAGAASTNIAGVTIELQRKAATALLNAFNEAKSAGLSITPRHPEDSARRSYAHTYTLWNGRFNKACDYWKQKGRLTESKISQLKALPIKQQVAEVLELEKQGIYFSTNFDKSILYSVAAPGTSQHLSMLAFDAKEFASKRVRKIMAKHGWFRTVQSDAPHFTFLGYTENELPSLGLKKVNSGGGEFWIPDV